MAQPAMTNFFLHCRSFNIVTEHFPGIGITTINTTTKHYNFPQPQDPKMSVSSRQAIFAFIIGVLLNFLQVKYQGKDESPFETHPTTMFVAIASLLVYCLSYDAKLRISAGYNYFLRIIMALSAPLSLASILSVLFPKSLYPSLFTLSIMFSVSQLPAPFQIRTIWSWLMKAVINITYKFCHQPHQQPGERRRGALMDIVQRLPWLPAAAEHAIVVNQMDMLPF